jgi:hypothetical protein
MLRIKAELKEAIEYILGQLVECGYKEKTQELLAEALYCNIVRNEIVDQVKFLADPDYSFILDGEL